MKIYRNNIINIDTKQRINIENFTNNNRGLIFHEIRFNEIVSEVFNTKLSYLTASINKDQMIGFCPLHTIKKRLIKLSYSNPTNYGVPYGGWVFDNNEVGINELIKKSKLSFNESLIYRTNIDINEDSISIPNSSEYQTAIVDLSMDIEKIWEAIIHSKRRNMIRKAEKSGIKIEFFGPEGFKYLNPLIKETQKKSGGKALSEIFFKKILEDNYNKKKAIILIAKKDNEILSGIFLIGNKNMMHYWQGASKHEVKNLGQGELLQWEAIKWSKENGSRYYDLCVIERERLPHIARFKLGFSRQLVSFYSMTIKNLSFKLLNRMEKWF